MNSTGSAPGRRAGFVGLGLMGAPMAANLAAGGWDVTGWNRSEGAFDAVPAIKRAASVGDLRDEPVIVFMLPDLPSSRTQPLACCPRGGPCPRQQVPPSSS